MRFTGVLAGTDDHGGDWAIQVFLALLPLICTVVGLLIAYVVIKHAVLAALRLHEAEKARALHDWERGQAPRPRRTQPELPGSHGMIRPRED